MQLIFAKRAANRRPNHIDHLTLNRFIVSFHFTFNLVK